ncbi:MAG: hypothetical protein SVV67_08255 [Bacillota bacterium]|nr:hypothetical protein [Bacillota bacterium]
MKLYRFKLYPVSSFITPWHSDMIMGSLCWVMKQLYGEQELKNYLNLCLRNEYPYVISNCFPGDFLPKPLAGNYSLEKSNISKNEAMAEFDKGKMAKKTSYVTLDEFNNIISGKKAELASGRADKIQISVLHNTVSRLSGTTVEGSLFEQPEIFICESYLSLYVLIKSDWLERFQDMLNTLSKRGLGKRASVGKGAFKAGEPEEYNIFASIDKPNAKVMLSNYIPAESDPVYGQYRAFIKYGKLGNEYAASKNPFKKPVLMFQPGSVFRDGNVNKKIYGRTFSGISLEKPEVVQFGCALAISASIENF